MKWIPLTESLPPSGKDVLIAGKDGSVQCRYYVPPKGDYCWGWYPGGWPFENASHWMPLPDHPKTATHDP